MHRLPIDEHGEKVLREGSIISSDESPKEMLDRIIESIADTDKLFRDPVDTRGFLQDLRHYLLDGAIVPNTTILTNLWRHPDKPLSACTVPDVDLSGDLAKLKTTIDSIHLDGMWTGFNLDEAEDPIRTLDYLNQIWVDLQNSWSQERPVGNMWVLSVYHPQILAFISHKVWADDRGEKWNFNLSVALDAPFMEAVKHDGDVTLRDGQRIPAKEIFDAIAHAAHSCADPGILFMDRLQEGNTTPSVWVYTAVAPCGETGLAKWETCNFASLNIAYFITDGGQVDYEWLSRVTALLVRYLDDITEYNIERYNDITTQEVMKAKRKIGIGVCGIADALIKLQMPYGSHGAITFASNIMSSINYHSKRASIDLAKHRGSFGAFAQSLYMQDHIAHRYSHHPTDCVSRDDWMRLNQDAKKYGMRNSHTVILPPTGRSSLVFGVSPQIEPIFTLEKPGGWSYLPGHILKTLPNKSTLSIQDETLQCISEAMRGIYRSAREIPIKEHMDMLSAFQTFSDESVSKTVNLPNDATVDDIRQVYLDAYDRGLCGVTVYRDGSKAWQPIKLSQ